jgi:uncharacterized membrane protein YedE/YeeE
MIGLFVPLLLWFGNKQFGISGSLRDFVAVAIRAKEGLFHYDADKSSWRLWFSLGIVGAGLLLSFLPHPAQTGISGEAHALLASQGVTDQHGLFPAQLLGGEHGFTLAQVLYCVIGGLFVGFGTRYAGGCTSGHSIMGLSQLSLASLLATIAFFAGGLIMTHLIFPSLLPALIP